VIDVAAHDPVEAVLDPQHLDVVEPGADGGGTDDAVDAGRGAAARREGGRGVGAARMTVLMPGAGPPPTRMARRRWWVMRGAPRRRVARTAGYGSKRECTSGPPVRCRRTRGVLRARRCGDAAPCTSHLVRDTRASSRGPALATGRPPSAP